MTIFRWITADEEAFQSGYRIIANTSHGSRATQRVAMCERAAMPQSIPPGLKKEHIFRALTDLDSGIDHPFGAPTGYELVHDDKRYAPKAVVGLACRYSIGRSLT